VRSSRASERSLRAIVAQSNQEHIEEEAGERSVETDPSVEDDFHPDTTRKRIQETLDQLLHKSLTAPTSTTAERRLIIKSWAAIIVVVIGAILLIRLVIVRPWSPRAPKTPKSAALAQKDAAAGLGIISASTTTRAAQAGDTPAVQDAEAIEAAADQLQRMAFFLVSRDDPSAPPPNPAHYESLLPPLAQKEIPGPNSTTEQQDRYEILQYQRQALGESLAVNLQAARTAGITREQAAAVAGQLLREAHSIRKKLNEKSDATAPTPLPPSIAALSNPSPRDAQEAIRQLLGPEIGKKLQASRGKASEEQ
jgi:hypothetical protein